MIMGTPGRPGITISKPPPAKAGRVVPIRNASARRARMVSRLPVSSAYSAKVGTVFAIRIHASYKAEHFLAANRIPLCRKMLHVNLAERASLMVKAADKAADKPNAQAFALVQLQPIAIS